MDGNPLHWIQQHSTLARTSSLAWCGLIMFVDSLLFLHPRPWEVYDQTQFWLAVGMVLHMSFASITALRKQRESGALELLLITPLGSSQLVWNCICGFWRRFLPPILLLVLLAQAFVWQEIVHLNEFHTFLFRVAASLVVGFLCIPAVGFYASLQFRSFGPAFLLIGVTSLALPLMFGLLGVAVELAAAVASIQGLRWILGDGRFAAYSGQS